MKTKEWYRLSLLAACLLWLSLSLTGCGNASYFETKESGAEAEVSGETDSGDETGGTKGAEQGTGTFGQDPKKQDTDVCYVHVTGAVAHPGVYQLPAGSRVYQAIEMAGGLTEQASEREINLAEASRTGRNCIFIRGRRARLWCPQEAVVSWEISERRMAAPMPGSISTRRIRRNL